MAEWAVEFDDHGLQRDLERAVLLLNDLRPLWPRVATLAVSWLSRQFDSEGSFFGDPWQPLSPEYAAWKTINFPGKSILSAEGDLRRAATTPTRRSSAHSLTLEIRPYAKKGQEVEPGWFQDGTDKMPARPLLFDHVLPGEPRSELDLVASMYVSDMLKRLGLT